MGLWDGYDNLGDRLWFDSLTPWAPEGYDQGDWTKDNLDGYTSPNAPLNTGLDEAGLGGAVGSEVNKVKDQTTYAHGRTSFKDLPKRKIKFNPPLHKTMRPKGGSSTKYAPRYGAGDKDQVWENPDKRTKGEWRLGHIVGGDEVLKSYKDDPELKYRHGFRFLYNPTSITMNAAINKNISPSAIKDGSGSMLISSAGIGTVSLELLLNRIPEVNASDKENDLTDEEKDLRDKGTMVDLDYLFRVANGTWGIVKGFGMPSVKTGKKGKKVKDARQDEYVSETGDIGIVMPTPAWLTLGPGLRYYGWMQSVNFKHTMFSEDMVPMLTRVTIVFQRIFKGTQSQFDELNKAASQAAVISGDVFEPPPDTKTVDGKGTGEEYPPWPSWEKSFFSNSLPGPKEAYDNVLAAARAIHSEFPEIEEVGGFEGRQSDPYPDHPSGLALDIMMPHGCPPTEEDRALGNKIAKFFMNGQKRFAVKYMIWHQKIWNSETDSPTDPPDWRDMSDRGDCTSNHMDHVHLALYPAPNAENWAGSSPGHPTNRWPIKKGTYWTESSGAVNSGQWMLPNHDIVNETGTMNFYQDGASHRGRGGPHQGEDYGINYGKPFHAMNEGKVVGTLGGDYGTVYIDYKVPAGTLQSCYMHCSKFFVEVGDRVQRGEVVSECGSTGANGAHLHLEFRLNGNLLNPNEVIRALGWKYPAMNGGYAPGGYAGREADFSSGHMAALRRKLLGESGSTGKYGRTGT